MKKTIALCCLAAIVGFTSKPAGEKLSYPEAKKSGHIDTYFGTEVADPYQWLEDQEAEDVKDWVQRQQTFTEKYLSQFPDRAKIKKRLTEIWTYGKMSAPFKKGGNYFYYKNDGTQNHDALYVRESLDGDEKLVIDPNTFSEAGTTAMSSLSISNDGKYAAYAISGAGSDWKEIQVMEIATGTVLPDKVEWVKFSGISWKGDGFFYSRYDVPVKGQEYTNQNEFHKVLYHQLNTAQTEDLLIFDDKANAKRNFYANVSDDEHVLFLSSSESTSGNAVRLANIADWTPGQALQFKTLTDEFTSDFWMVDNDVEGVLIMTNHNAPRYKLISVDVRNPSLEGAIELIPEREYVLESVTNANEKYIAKYLRNVRSYVEILNTAFATESVLELPQDIGIVGSISAESSSPEVFYSFVNYTMPASIYKLNVETGESELFFKPTIDFDSEAYETKQVFYKSKDGTEIPMFITHKKGLKITGANPTFLFGYGGFNISYTPEFRVDRSIFLENGGIYAVANLRGGGEFGEEWHEAGTKLKKQNVFDDFIAAAEYLISEGYTSKDKLAVHGRSNGGLLVGAVMTQRPDLFKVAIPKVGVLDMLKYHTFTIGWAWETDYGDSKDSVQFQNLLSYSPVHNVKAVAYPATFVVTGDHDDRVVPAHSFKFMAQLQANQQGTNPVLIRIDSDAGHGAGKPISKKIEEFTDTWTFVFHHLGMHMQ